MSDMRSSFGIWFGCPSDETALPRCADEFARRTIFAICGASVADWAARQAYERCMRALAVGLPVRAGFRHPTKAEAIDRIWREREDLYGRFVTADDKLAFLGEIPWIGSVTKRRLARSFGLFGVGHEDRQTEPARNVA